MHAFIIIIRFIRENLKRNPLRSMEGGGHSGAALKRVNTVMIQFML